jgi:starch synthase
MVAGVKILFSSSELAPLCQSGGLGDAVSGLARALGAAGHDVTVVVPAYRSALRHAACPMLHEHSTLHVHCRTDGGGSINVHGRVLVGALFPGVQVAFVDLPTLFDRPGGLYGEGGADFSDNGLRFIAFARAAAYVAEAMLPDVVVAHDWHAGLTIGALRTSLARGAARGIATVQVVHNNAHQGRLPSSCFALTGLATDLWHPEGVETWGELNLLKAGVAFADRVVAVSPTYAREITTSSFGEGLEGLYRACGDRLVGIVNGIDTMRFDPAVDGALTTKFSATDPSGKAACRAALLSELGLATPRPGRFVTAIGRLAAQKGWDVLHVAIEGLVNDGCSLALIGDGDAAMSRALSDVARRYPDRVWFYAGFNESLSRRMYAGADVVLVPSRFEPCGLVQLIAQRYGTVPVAHTTGGLVDTIVDLHDPVLGRTQGSGVLFSPLTAQALVDGVRRVAGLADEGGLPALQQRLLGLDVSWQQPAQAWVALLDDAVAEATLRR